MPLDYIRIKEAVESNRFDWERAGLPYAIKNMTRQQRIYKVLKKYLTEIDRWKNLKRGKPNPNYKWTRSYFVSTAGNVSSDTIRKYIEAQTKK